MQKGREVRGAAGGLKHFEIRNSKFKISPHSPDGIVDQPTLFFVVNIQPLGVNRRLKDKIQPFGGEGWKRHGCDETFTLSCACCGSQRIGAAGAFPQQGEIENFFGLEQHVEIFGQADRGERDDEAAALGVGWGGVGWGGVGWGGVEECG